MDEQDELTPAQSEAVRRLLAGARHDEGIPDEVAARLEAVLEELSAERATPVRREAVVIPLRRRWPKVLVAAAAVTAFGFGFAQLVGNSANDAGGGVTAESSSDRDALTTDDFGSGQEIEPNAPVPAGTPGDNSAVDGAARLQTLSQSSLNLIGIQGLRPLSPGTLDRDLEELTRTSAAEADGGDNKYDVSAARTSCGPYYTVSGGETFAASYRRHLALVLFHPRLDGVRLVEIYDCESRTPRQAVRTVTLQTGE